MASDWQSLSILSPCFSNVYILLPVVVVSMSSILSVNSGYSCPEAVSSLLTAPSLFSCLRCVVVVRLSLEAQLLKYMYEGHIGFDFPIVIIWWIPSRNMLSVLLSIGEVRILQMETETKGKQLCAHNYGNIHALFLHVGLHSFCSWSLQAEDMAKMSVVTGTIQNPSLFIFHSEDVEVQYHFMD